MTYREDDPLIVGFAAAQATMDRQERRIEALEAALREVMDAYHDADVQVTWGVTRITAAENQAEVALAEPEAP